MNIIINIRLIRKDGTTYHKTIKQTHIGRGDELRISDPQGTALTIQFGESLFDRFRNFLTKLFKKDLEFEKISSSFPEQYLVYQNGEQVAYLRLRHGVFTIEMPDACDKLVYKAKPEGQGMFLDEERKYYLAKATQIIKAELGIL